MESHDLRHYSLGALPIMYRVEITMSEIKITAEPRPDFGKGYARRIRAAGNIPAVIYGNGKEPKHVILGPRDHPGCAQQGCRSGD